KREPKRKRAAAPSRRAPEPAVSLPPVDPKAAAFRRAAWSWFTAPTQAEGGDGLSTEPIDERVIEPVERPAPPSKVERLPEPDIAAADLIERLRRAAWSWLAPRRAAAPEPPAATEAPSGLEEPSLGAPESVEVPTRSDDEATDARAPASEPAATD